MTNRHWDQDRITNWAVSTFGTPRNALHLVNRARLEFDELEELITETTDLKHVQVDKVLSEIADIVIVLSQVVEHLGGDLDSEVDKKMYVNASRQWLKTDDGVGRHV